MLNAEATQSNTRNYLFNSSADWIYQTGALRQCQRGTTERYKRIREPATAHHTAHAHEILYEEASSSSVPRDKQNEHVEWNEVWENKIAAITGFGIVAWDRPCNHSYAEVPQPSLFLAHISIMLYQHWSDRTRSARLGRFRCDMAGLKRAQWKVF